MEWWFNILNAQTVPAAIVVISLVVVSGWLIGKIRIAGIGLGVSGVLFTGLLFAHFGARIDKSLLEFIRESGLIIFVYCIGLQVGPSLVEALRHRGLMLNVIAAITVFLGVILTFGFYYFADMPMPIAVGIFAGGTTNTPALGAAQQVLEEMGRASPEMLKNLSLSYAVGYPFGIVGVIIIMLIMKAFFKVSPEKEASNFREEQRQRMNGVVVRNLKVSNKQLDGCFLSEVPLLSTRKGVATRVISHGSIEVANPSLRIHLGDVITVTGSAQYLEELRKEIGEDIEYDEHYVEGEVGVQTLLVTHGNADGIAVASIEDSYGVNVSIVRRAEVEIVPTRAFRLQLGDNIVVVGKDPDLKSLSMHLGDSVEQLQHPRLIPFFLGIIVGVLIGIIPIPLPGLPSPIKLGIAGGPLLVAIILSKIGRVGKLNWYMSHGAKLMLKDLGITLFLACVGLHSGDTLMNIFLEGDGYYWMICSAIMTFVPTIAVSFIVHRYFNLNYLSNCGLMAGSMTNSPALEFSNDIVKGSNAAAIAYASVYPLVMLLRVLAAQIMVMFFS